MSLKIKNKKGQVIANLEDDFTEPKWQENPWQEESCDCKGKCKKCKQKKEEQMKALDELIKLTEEMGLYTEEEK